MQPERDILAKHHPLYKRWAQMRQVCYNSRHSDYPNFGGRGITIGPEFERFWDFADLIEDKLGYPEGFCYLTKLSRKNLNGNFTLKNMCWDTAKYIGRRLDRTYILKYKGQTKPVKQWSEEFNINFHTLHNRIKAGWTAQQCLGFKLGPRQAKIAKKGKHVLHKRTDRRI
jgi:hypothetical protein